MRLSLFNFIFFLTPTHYFKIRVENIDVFCEKGVYELDDSRRILEAGMKHGLALNFHGEELNYLGCGRLLMRLEKEGGDAIIWGWK